MSKRITIILDDDLTSKLRKIQAEQIKKSEDSMSFSQVINETQKTTESLNQSLLRSFCLVSRKVRGFENYSKRFFNFVCDFGNILCNKQVCHLLV